MTDTADLLAASRCCRVWTESNSRPWPATSANGSFRPDRSWCARAMTTGSASSCVAEGEGVITVDGKEVGKVGPGSYFGEVALISDRVRTATVTATTDLRCEVMTLWDFRSFVAGGRRGGLETPRARRRDAARQALIARSVTGRARGRRRQQAVDVVLGGEVVDDPGPEPGRAAQAGGGQPAVAGCLEGRLESILVGVEGVARQARREVAEAHDR